MTVYTSESLEPFYIGSHVLFFFKEYIPCNQNHSHSWGSLRCTAYCVFYYFQCTYVCTVDPHEDELYGTCKNWLHK